jgi:hypothetical protein
VDPAAASVFVFRVPSGTRGADIERRELFDDMKV